MTTSERVVLGLQGSTLRRQWRAEKREAVLCVSWRESSCVCMWPALAAVLQILTTLFREAGLLPSLETPKDPPVSASLWEN